MCRILRFGAEFSVFAHFFAFFAPEREKTQKCVFERKVPLAKRIYIRSNLDHPVFHFWSHFFTFLRFGAQKVPRGAKKLFFAHFCSQKRKNATFAFWTGKYLPEPYVYKAFCASAKRCVFYDSLIFKKIVYMLLIFIYSKGVFS